MFDFIARAVLLVPSVVPHLRSGFYKTYDYMLQVIERSVTAVYNGNMGGEFVDILSDLIKGQLTQAYMQAWEDSGETSHELPDYLKSSLEDAIIQNNDADFIYQYFQDVVDARVDGTPIDPLLSRADMWSARYNEAYNAATAAIVAENGGNLEWVFGDTDHCDTCEKLNGIVAYASEWEAAGFAPQNAPNDMLDCGGWKCQCKLRPTDQRRSPRALETLMNIAEGV